MARPQESELRERLREFLDEEPDAHGHERDYRSLIIHDPESGAKLSSGYRWGQPGDEDEVEDEDVSDEDFAIGEDVELIPCLRFDWPASGDREREIAGRLGVPAPRKVR